MGVGRLQNRAAAHSASSGRWPDGFAGKTAGEHRLADLGRTDQQDVGGLLDKGEGGLVVDDVAVERWHRHRYDGPGHHPPAARSCDSRSGERSDRKRHMAPSRPGDAELDRACSSLRSLESWAE
jgi:hypothetical protein